MLTSQEAAQSLNDWFVEAEKIYKQEGNFYISTKTMQIARPSELNGPTNIGLHLAVIQSPEHYKFSIYTLGNRKDVDHIRTLFKENVFKTCCCSLCPIADSDNTVRISTEQNQLYSDPKNNPSFIINHSFRSNRDLYFRIVGTTPQYFYNHLMMVSENHIPSYGIFLDFQLFQGVMEFLHYSNNEELVAYHNGNFGSDKYHFHVHLSDQANETLSKIIEDSINEILKIPAESGKFKHNQGIIKCISYIDTDLKPLFLNVSNDIMEIFNQMVIDPYLDISSTLFVRTKGDKKFYGIVINIINLSQSSWNYNGCTYSLMPASYVLIANCFPTSMDHEEYKLFLQELSTHYTNFYKDPADMFCHLCIPYQPNQKKYHSKLQKLKDDIVQKFTQKGLSQVLIQYPLEFIYFALQSLDKSIRVTTEEATTLLKYVMDTPCLELNEQCDNAQMGKFKYFLGLAINNIDDIDIIFQEQYLNTLIASELYLLRYYSVNSDYLYLRGSFTQNLIGGVINNLIRITSINPTAPLAMEKHTVSTWLDYIFNKIGQPSASGIVTESQIINTEINFIMKIMDTQLVEKQKEFIHEFFTSSIINDIRIIIPNFILCFGGFFCNSTSKETLCDRGVGKNFSYLLLENVKGEELSKVVQPSRVGGVSTSMEDIVDIMFQITGALAFAYNIKHFTHYDLHLNNIMQFDFVHNPNYLELFSNYPKSSNTMSGIQKILFKYFMDDKDPTSYIYVPVKCLYLIIDYGSAYVDGMPKNSTWLHPRRYDKGFTSDKPNEIADIYSFYHNMFIIILTNQPYLMISTEIGQEPKWIKNNLVKLFIKWLTGYKVLYKTATTQLLRGFLSEHVSTRNFTNYLNSQRWSPTDAGYERYLVETIKPEEIDEDFRGASNVFKWMSQNLYSQPDFETMSRSNSTYVFNWGYIPPGTMDGIEPTSDVKELIRSEKEQTTERITALKEFLTKMEVKVGTHDGLLA
jgi:hypothetical protein